MAASELRIVVLVNDTPAGRGLLAGLVQRGVAVAGAIVETAFELRYCYRGRTSLGRLAETPLALARSLWRRARARRLLASHLGAGTSRLLTTRRDDEKAQRFVAALGTDVLVLAGVGLVGRELLAIPRLGSLNAHPGLVPWVRGNGAVCNAILRGVAVGASCHRVDPGIDTGPVISRRLLPVRGSETLELLEERAVALGTALLVDVVADAVERRALPEGRVQRERYPLCRWQDAQGRAAAAELLAAGRASELYHRWKPLCRTPESDELLDVIPPESVPPVAVAPSRSHPPQPVSEPATVPSATRVRPL